MTDDIVERLRNSDGFKVFRAGDGPLALAADTDLMRRAADEIERLRYAVMRSAIHYNDFDDGTGGYYRCQVCGVNGKIRQLLRDLKHADDCVYAEAIGRSLEGLEDC